MTMLTANFINDVIPIAGVIVGIYAVFSKNIKTKHPANGAFLHLSLLLWYALLWADWSGIHEPVWQTIASRAIVFTMVLLQIKATKRIVVPCPLKRKRIRRTRYFKNIIK